MFSINTNIVFGISLTKKLNSSQPTLIFDRLYAANQLGDAVDGVHAPRSLEEIP